MNAKRHVSRWQRCIDTTASGSTNEAEPPMSLRYLNEFVGKLHCASALLDHQLFPDAKEITESMGLFNAVRRYIFPNTTTDADHATKPDGIIVVGDGNTPRSAALFAYRLRQWTCYSVDPAMETTTERAVQWQQEIPNLVVIRNKIEHVSIHLRRAIIVLVHAHVTLPQALSAVQADDILGVVTLPCCNWYGKQEELFGRHPDLVYDDFSILSDHREIRLWIGGEHANSRDFDTKSHGDLVQSATVMKGCIRKTFVSDSTGTKTSKRGKYAARITPTTFLQRLLSPSTTKDATSNDMVLTAAMQVVLKQTVASILLLDVSQAISTVVHRILSLCHQHQQPTMAVYTLQSQSSGDDTQDSWTCGLVQWKLDHTGTVHQKDAGSITFTDSSSTIKHTGSHTIGRFHAVLDLGLLYAGLRDQSKAHGPVLLQQTIRWLLRLTQRVLVSVSPRKDWRKRGVFPLDDQWQLASFTAHHPNVDTTEKQHTTYVYSLTQHRNHDQPPRLNEAAAVPSKEDVFAVNDRLERDFNQRFPTEIPQLSIVRAMHHAHKDPIRVHGTIVRLRRFTRGMCFATIVPVSTVDASSSLQLFFQYAPHLEAQWTKAFYDLITHKCLHQRDQIEVAGVMGLNDRHESVLYVQALRILANNTFQRF